MNIYSDFEEIGYTKDSKFDIVSYDSLRALNNKTILNFLIDEQNKNVSFLFLEKNKPNVVNAKYEKITFTKGQENFYNNRGFKF